MAAEKPFLVPVVIDGTQEREAHVPEPFRTAQWTRLPGGETSAALCERIKLLLAGSAPTVEREPVQPDQTRTAETRTKPRRWAAVAAIALLVAVSVAWQLVRVRPPGASPVADVATMPAEVAAAEKSIAVLPFVDTSEKKNQEYFSDGLSEELIDRLSHDADLKVIARTSSFAFKGKNEDMRSIAKALGVANLLEGSVRKADMELRVTAQLIRASDGVHLWSES